MNKLTSLALLMFLFQSCVLKAPEIKVTGERTLLEQQILGTYHDLHSELWMISSRRDLAPDSTGKGLNTASDSVVDAYLTREYNRDDVVEFASTGIFYEGADGQLGWRDSTRVEGSERRYAGIVLTEENQARQVILNRLVELYRDTSPEEQIRSIFINAVHEEAPAGCWFLNADQTWEQKN